MTKTTKTTAKATAKAMRLDAAKAPAKMAPAKVEAPKMTAIQTAMIKQLTRPQGATAAECQKAAGSKTKPNAFFLDRWATRFGYVCFADYREDETTIVYQFVRPGQKPTAY
jgi:hypothetical protein